MNRILQNVIAIAGLLLAMANAQACEFYWHYYGDNTIKDLIGAQLANHVTDEFCGRYTKRNEIVLEFDSFVMPNGGCVGYANASMRPKGSKIQQAKAIASAHENPQCRTSSEANLLTVQAALDAVDKLMSDLGRYQMTR